MKIGVCTSKGLSINLLQKESDMKSVGIVLSGCGVFDGSEIHESVLSLLSLTQSGAQVYFFAPDEPQRTVINHLSGEEKSEKRNMLEESARISRGEIRPLAEADASQLDALIVPGGFGERGVEGMILAAEYARTNKVPYFGICLGMQVAVIEFARNAAMLHGANSGEFDKNCKYKVIDFMPGQSDERDKGGTLRLGSYPCKVVEGTKLQQYYGADETFEYYKWLSQNSRYPVYAYITPVLNCDPVQFARRLARLDNVAGIKLTISDYYAFGAITAETGDRLNILNGPDETMICGLALGADGAIGTSYNYMPATATAIYDNFRKGNIDDARRYQRLLNRYIDVNFGKSIAFWKTILSSLKWDSQSWGLPGMWAAVKSLSPRIFTFSGLTFRESTPCISGLFLKAPWEPAAWKQPT